MLTRMGASGSLAAQESTPSGGLVPISTPASGDATGELAGTVIIAVQGTDVQTYQALADAYMALNPGVEIRVEL